MIKRLYSYRHLKRMDFQRSLS